MPISIRRATQADMPAVGHISHYAFRTHPWTLATYPTEDAAGNIARYTKRHSSALSDSANTLFVAVDGSPSDPAAPVVGYSKWTIYPEPRPESEWNKPAETTPVPPGARQDASDLPSAMLHAMRLKNYRGDPMVFLHFLIVGPEMQRRGVGGKLLDWGLRKADELGVPAWLESTEEGYGLYYRNGFRTVDEMTFGTERWGGERPIHLKCMKYEPGTKAGAKAETGT